MVVSFGNNQAFQVKFVKKILITASIVLVGFSFASGWLHHPRTFLRPNDDLLQNAGVLRSLEAQE